jgi:hypothetical protein
MKAGSKSSVAISESVLAQFDAILDVRSPAEYAEDHIPLAHSCPVLDDASAQSREPCTSRTRSRPGAPAQRSSRETLPATWKPVRRQARRHGSRWSTAGAAASARARWRTCCARSAGTPGRSKGGYKSYRKHVVETLSGAAAALSLPRRARRDRQRQEPVPARAEENRSADARSRRSRRAPRLGARQPAGAPATFAEDVREPAASASSRPSMQASRCMSKAKAARSASSRCRPR